MSISVKRERPILMSGEMVRAILAGRKSQTRRVVTIRARDGGGAPNGAFESVHVGSHAIDETPRRIFGVEFRAPNGADLVVECPYGQPGDRLWVRETWFDNMAGNVKYRATDPAPDFTINGRSPWRGGVIMPRSLSRLTLEITDVRVERLQTISDADAAAEGVQWESRRDGTPLGYIADTPRPDNVFPPRIGYWRLWDSLNAERGYGWDVNPWVWVIGFRRETASPTTESTTDDATPKLARGLNDA